MGFVLRFHCRTTNDLPCKRIYQIKATRSHSLTVVVLETTLCRLWCGGYDSDFITNLDNTGNNGLRNVLSHINYGSSGTIDTFQPTSG